MSWKKASTVVLFLDLLQDEIILLMLLTTTLNDEQFYILKGKFIRPPEKMGDKFNIRSFFVSKKDRATRQLAQVAVQQYASL